MTECRNGKRSSKSCMSLTPSNGVRRPPKRSLDQSFQARQMGVVQMRMSLQSVSPSGARSCHGFDHSYCLILGRVGLLRPHLNNMQSRDSGRNPCYRQCRNDRR